MLKNNNNKIRLLGGPILNSCWKRKIIKYLLYIRWPKTSFLGRMKSFLIRRGDIIQLIVILLLLKYIIWAKKFSLILSSNFKELIKNFFMIFFKKRTILPNFTINNNYSSYKIFIIIPLHSIFKLINSLKLYRVKSLRYNNNNNKIFWIRSMRWN